MDYYILKLDKELLELGAVDLNPPLAAALHEMQGPGSTIEIINEKGNCKSLNINEKDGLLEGRGLKTFFSPFKTDLAFLEISHDNKIRVLPPVNTDKSHMKTNLPLNRDNRTERVLEAMANLHSDSPKLFDIYHQAQEFMVHSDEDRLVCLPHLRDMDIYEYQVKTVKSVLNRFRGRVMLSDEVGLGKTIEAGMAMLEYIMRGLVKKILVLVPPSLVDQWYFEMKRKFNQDFIRFDDPEFKSKGDQAWTHYSKVIASLSTAKRKNNSDVISQIHYDLVIIDEAHHLKNRKTMAWQFINKINKKYIFLLTATPVQNNLEELYNLITLLKPGQLKTYSYFKKNFVGDKEGIEAKNVGQLRNLISSVMIRNKRSDIDIKFTKRFASTHIVRLTPDEYRLYADISAFIRERYNDPESTLTRFVLKSLQEEMGSSFYALSHTLQKMVLGEKIRPSDKNLLEGFLETSRQITKESTANPKIIMLLKLLSEFKDKMLIFTKYKATQEVIIGFLKKQGYEVAEFHGGLKRKEKEEQIAFFKEKADVLVSTEAGGEGRNLQFCNGMVNFDLPWNPMAIEQRIGRIHRVGQTRDVYVYNLAANDTVEYYILDLLDRKINMFELVVGEVDMILGDLEEEEDFSDIIMNTWTSSNNMEEVVKKMEKLGNKLLENKKQCIKIKELDDNLFGDSFETEK